MTAPTSKPFYVERELEELVLRRTRQALRQRRLEENKPRQPIIDWAEQNFYVPDTDSPIVFAPHQRAILLAAFTRGSDGHFPYRLVILSSVKKSGKTCLAAVIARWIAEEQTRFGEIATTANDQRQAKERVYEQIAKSIRLTPGYKNKGTEGYLKDRWLVQATRLLCLTTGTKIEALSVDARGEAGANPDLTTWCVTGDTETLTRKGFKHTDELTLEDEIATLNPETGYMEWHKPRAVNVKPYDGPMVRFNHRRASFVVTPNHRVYGQFFTNSRYAGKRKIVHKQKKYLDGWRFEEAATAAKYIGGEIKADGDWKGESYIDPRYARLLGYHIAEGCCQNGYVIIYQNTDSPVYENIYQTALSLGYNPKKKERRITIRDKELYSQLVPLGRSWEKYIPEEIKNAQPEALREFFLGYMLGDGWGETVNLQDRCSDGGQCCTVSEKLADDLIEVGMKIGYIPRLMSAKQEFCTCPTCKQTGIEKLARMSYRLSFSTHPIVWERSYGKNKDPSHWNIEHYEGNVACPSVPHGIFYIRHEGKCCWTGNTELWGYEDPAAVRFFHEMTPPPTKPDSIRLIETYAGFDGESLLLKEHYDLGMSGRQLTAGELTEMTGEPMGCFVEATKMDDLVPIWINENAGMFMYWDSGLLARRMPWQQGEIGERYYIKEEHTLPVPTFHRLHMNEWVGGEEEFLPHGAWDACKEDLPFLEPGDRTPAILGVDAASTHDCFAIVLVTRHPQRHDDPAIRACKVWDPAERGGKTDYDEPEAFIRTLVHGGCLRGHPQYSPFRKPVAECDHASRAYGCEICCEACAINALAQPYNIIEISYDRFQLESMMGRMYKEGINTQIFSQMQERAVADRMFYDVIVQRRLAHDGDPALKKHLINCNAKMSKDDDSKMRLIKKSADRKIDLAVASSMAIKRCLYLLM